jgi:hypothetical protein
MPTPTYDLIASTTLAASSAEVVFGSLPQTYRDLILVTNAATSSSSNNGIRFNGDTGSNYTRVFMAGGGSAASGTGGGGTSIQIDYFGFTGTTLGEQVCLINLMDYSATNKHKTILIRNNRNGANTGAEAIAGRWASTSAITSINLFSITGGGITWAAGSTFNLYGVIS